MTPQVSTVDVYNNWIYSDIALWVTSNFPRFDRNLNTGEAPTHVILPITPRDKT
jgi:hypothetical protein